MLKRILLCIMALLCLTFFVSCMDDVWSGEDVIVLTRPPETTLLSGSDLSVAASDTVTAPDTATTAETTITAAPDALPPETVYWVAGGSVWHTDSTCSSLRRSSEILHGTVEEAQAAGKARLCKHCAAAVTSGEETPASSAP